MRMRTAVVLLVVGWGNAALAGEPSKEECKRIISAEKKPMDACVEKKCRKLGDIDMKTFHACFDRCATEQSPKFAVCYQQLLESVPADVVRRAGDLLLRGGGVRCRS